MKRIRMVRKFGDRKYQFVNQIYNEDEAHDLIKELHDKGWNAQCITINGKNGHEPFYRIYKAKRLPNNRKKKRQPLGRIF